MEEVKIKIAFMEGRVMELERNQAKLERENDRLRQCEIKLAQMTTKLEERKAELQKEETTNGRLRDEAVKGSLVVNELEFRNRQREENKQKLENKMAEMEEEIKNLYKENVSLKAQKDQSATQTPTVSFAEILKKRCGESTRKNKTNRNKQKEHRLTIIIKPKEGESIKDAGMRLTGAINRQDRINFQITQAKSALIL